MPGSYPCISQNILLIHEAGCSGPVHWDDPQGWDGDGVGRGVQDGEHVYTLG